MMGKFFGQKGTHISAPVEGIARNRALVYVDLCSLSTSFHYLELVVWMGGDNVSKQPLKTLSLEMVVVREGGVQSYSSFRTLNQES